jgi:hypothetical protein
MNIRALSILDISKNSLGAEGAEAIATLLGDGRLSEIDISNNQLCGVWRAPSFVGFKALVNAIEQHGLLSMDSVNMAEELDVSGQYLRADAKILARFIKDNVALVSLSLANNNLRVEGAKHLAEVLPEW